MSHPAIMLRRALALAGLLVGTFAATAGAHATLASSDPVDGSSLEGAPSRIELRFDEAVSSRFRRVSLIDDRGAVVGGTRVGSGGDPSELVLAVPRLRHGTYVVSWDVLALGDGHVTGGQIVFGVGREAVVASPAAAARDTAPPALDVGLRWLDFVLLAAVLGGLAVAALIGRARARGALPAAEADTATRRVLRGAAVSAGLAGILGVALVVREAHGLLATLPSGTTDADALVRLLPERYGVLWLVREALLAALAGCAIALLASRRRPAVVLWAAAVAGCALGVCRALGSHAAAVDRSAPAVAADALHVLAAAIWIGGVLALTLAVWSVRASAAGAAGRFARGCGRPFGIAATAALVVLGATGLYAARVQITSVDGLLTTVYGRTLMAKTGVVLVVAALGLGNATLLRRLPRGLTVPGRGLLARIGAPRLLLAEASVGLLALLVAAALTASSPPRGPEFARPQAVRSPELARQVGDLLVTATARPNRPGTNVFTVVVVSSRRPAPGPIERVDLRIARTPAGSGTSQPVALRESAPGRYSGGARIAADGAWRMAVVATRGGRRSAAAFRWTVQPPDPARPVVHSARPLAPIIDRALLLLALVLVTALVLMAAAVVPRRLEPAGAISTIDTIPRETG